MIRPAARPLLPLSLVAVLALPLAGCGDGQADLDKRVTALERKVEALSKAAPAAERSTPAPSPAPSGTAPLVAPTPTAPVTYRPGAMAIAHAAPLRASQLDRIPADTIGSFVYSGGGMPLDDLSPQGVRYTDPAGVELQGWLKAEKAGRYQIGADLQSTLGGILAPRCILLGWIEDRLIGNVPVDLTEKGQQASGTPLFGADLTPGIYKLRLWVACAAERRARTTATILLKTPADMNLRGIRADEFVHKD